MRKLVRTILLLGAAGLAVAGCSKTTGPEPSDAPELPPLASLAMDLSFFSDHDPGRSPAGAASVQGTRFHFLNAAARVALVNVTVLAALTPPYLALEAALHTVPSRDDDGAHLWIYTWRNGGQDHQIRLRGTPGEDVVEWELYLGLQGGTPELWFRGESHTDRDEGYWVFLDFLEEGDPEELRVDWEATGETNARVDLEIVDPDHEEFGDELRYRVDADDRWLELFDASEAMTWDIRWNEADGSGSLLVPGYNDGARACWDGNQEDAPCEESAPAE